MASKEWNCGTLSSKLSKISRWWGQRTKTNTGPSKQGAKSNLQVIWSQNEPWLSVANCDWSLDKGIWVACAFFCSGLQNLGTYLPGFSTMWHYNQIVYLFLTKTNRFSVFVLHFHVIPFCTECQLPFILMLNFYSYFKTFFKCHVLWKPHFIRPFFTALFLHSMICMPPV